LLTGCLNTYTQSLDNMREQLISLETANLAKVLGFTISTVGSHVYCNYRSDGTTGDLSATHLHLDDAAAVPQSLLQKWLRETHKLNLNVHWHGKYDFVIKFEPERIVNERVNLYEQYEDALEEGLKASLKLLIT